MSRNLRAAAIVELLAPHQKSTTSSDGSQLNQLLGASGSANEYDPNRALLEQQIQQEMYGPSARSAGTQGFNYAGGGGNGSGDQSTGGLPNNDPFGSFFNNNSNRPPPGPNFTSPDPGNPFNAGDGGPDPQHGGGGQPAPLPFSRGGSSVDGAPSNYAQMASGAVDANGVRIQPNAAALAASQAGHTNVVGDASQVPAGFVPGATGQGNYNNPHAPTQQYVNPQTGETMYVDMSKQLGWQSNAQYAQPGQAGQGPTAPGQPAYGPNGQPIGTYGPDGQVQPTSTVQGLGRSAGAVDAGTPGRAGVTQAPAPTRGGTTSAINPINDPIGTGTGRKPPPTVKAKPPTNNKGIPGWDIPGTTPASVGKPDVARAPVHNLPRPVPNFGPPGGPKGVVPFRPPVGPPIAGPGTGTQGLSGERNTTEGLVFQGLANQLNSPGYDQATKNAMNENAMQAQQAQYAGANEAMNRSAAATGSNAGIAAGLASNARNEAGGLGDVARQNQVQFAQEAQRQKEAAMAGLSNLYGQQSGNYNTLLGIASGLAAQPVGTQSQNRSLGTGQQSTNTGTFGVSL